MIFLFLVALLPLALCLLRHVPMATRFTRTLPAVFLVFTEVAHRKRGKCCGSGCRHCPYNHANVREEQKLVLWAN